MFKKNSVVIRLEIPIKTLHCKVQTKLNVRLYAIFIHSFRIFI